MELSLNGKVAFITGASINIDGSASHFI